ncbi:MAG: hypothetical protein R6X15_05905 [Pseudomonadota bacterium]
MRRLVSRKNVITLLAVVAGILAYTGTVDEFGADYADKGFKRAMATFAVARALNGVISVAQGTEVAVQPAGVGINFTPGEILDPVNDLVERFSWIMLASSTSLGLQKLLLTIFSSQAFSLMIVFFLLLAIFALWYRGKQPSWLKPLLYRTALFMVIIRFCIPVVAFASEGVFSLFLKEQYTASTRHIEQTTDAIAEVNEHTEAGLPADREASLLERARQMLDSAAARVDVGGYVDRYKEVAADASEHAVNLIVIFILQTILLPLFFLWLLIRLLKTVVRLSTAF